MPHGAAFAGPWPERPAPGMSEGGDSRAADSDSKPGVGVGHCWGWEGADGTEWDSLNVVGSLREVAPAALMVAAHWEYTAGA
jgi:hypothetical protein